MSTNHAVRALAPLRKGVSLRRLREARALSAGPPGPRPSQSRARRPIRPHAERARQCRRQTCYLLCRRFHHQRMMSENRRLRTPSRRASMICRPVESSRSSPRITSAIRCSVSSACQPTGRSSFQDDHGSENRRTAATAIAAESRQADVIEKLSMGLYPHAPTDVVCQRQIAVATRPL